MLKKVLKLRKSLVVCVIIIIAFTSNAFTQGNTYKTNGNNNGTDFSKLGWKNHADLNIVTNDTTRLRIKKDGDVQIKKNLVVDGKIKCDSIHVTEVTCDSMKITQYLTADSIHVNSIKIGDNSLWIGGTLTGTSDFIQSGNPAICFGRMGGGFWNIRIGVGTTAPQTKMHLWDRSLVDVYTTYTHGTGNQNNTNGFQVGLAALDN